MKEFLSGSTRTEPALSQAEQSATLRKVTLRIVPLLLCCYVVAYIDRINVGFAKLHLQQVLGVDPKIFSSVYGLGAGLFFIGYFLFEVPSNLILHRVGARVWITRIMIVWGLASMSFMFMKGVTMFYVMRFLLGAAEAGFFPGVLLYFTYWYPAAERARIVAIFAVGGVIAGVVGSPISGAILHMDGIAGLAGWQWLFLIEALPAILLGMVVLFALPNGPAPARWLSDHEKGWIQSRLAAEARVSAAGQSHSLGQVFISGRVWLLCLVYFVMNIGSYGFEMWAPSIVKALSGQSDRMVGVINAIPYLISGIVMYMVGRHSDRTGDRRGHVAVSAVCASLGFALAGIFKNPYFVMAGLVIAWSGIKSTIGPFWALTTSFLSGTAAAGGIALINSVGNLGGFVGPTLVGIVRDQTGSDFAALYLLSGALLAMSVCTLMVRQPKPA